MSKPDRSQGQFPKLMTFRIDEITHAELAARAKAENRTIAALLRDLVEWGLEAE